MTKFFSALFVTLALTACNSGDPADDSTGDAPACPAGFETCGQQCMPIGNSCCPSDALSCPAGTLCNMDNLCVKTDTDQTGCLDGRERCGVGCMPVGSDCCDESKGSYCDVGTTCVGTDKCQSGGSVPTTSAPTANHLVTVVPGGNTSIGACGVCPGSGSWYTCSQWMAGDKCSWQSCACYFQLNGSDVTKAWYQTGAPDHITGCYQCDTVNTTCMPAAQALINACYNI